MPDVVPVEPVFCVNVVAAFDVSVVNAPAALVLDPIGVLLITVASKPTLLVHRPVLDNHVSVLLVAPNKVIPPPLAVTSVAPVVVTLVTVPAIGVVPPVAV